MALTSSTPELIPALHRGTAYHEMGWMCIKFHEVRWTSDFFYARAGSPHLRGIILRQWRNTARSATRILCTSDYICY